LKLRKTYIEITNVCNLACPFCGINTRASQFMDTALFTRILRQVKGISRHLYFHVMGEPLLHPRLGDFLDLCAPDGFKVHLVTNGRTLAQATPALFNKPALRQLSVSLHSVEHTMSDDAIDTLIASAKELAARGAEQGTFWVVLRLWNIGSADPAQVDTNARILHGLQRVLALSTSITTGSDTTVPLAPHLSLQFAPRFDWPNPAMPLQGALGTCHGLRDQCAILVDGTVVPCCLDGDGVMNLGSVVQRDLREILGSDRAVRMREGFHQGIVVEDLCRRCTYRRRFDEPSKGEHL
jgi:MoaA/NifB/PqqE/SkfB family radical SAM enzyme